MGIIKTFCDLCAVAATSFLNVLNHWNIWNDWNSRSAVICGSALSFFGRLERLERFELLEPGVLGLCVEVRLFLCLRSCGLYRSTKPAQLFPYPYVGACGRRKQMPKQQRGSKVIHLDPFKGK